MPTLCCAHGLIDARSIRSSRQTGVGAGRSLKSGSAPCEQGLALVQASTQFVIGRRRNGHVGSCEHPWLLQNSVWRSICTSCTKESSTCALQQHAANVGCRGPPKCDAIAQSHLAKPASSKAQFKRMWLRAWRTVPSNWSLWVGKTTRKKPGSSASTSSRRIAWFVHDPLRSRLRALRWKSASTRAWLAETQARRACIWRRWAPNRVGVIRRSARMHAAFCVADGISFLESKLECR
jgi:hypothetical protein